MAIKHGFVWKTIIAIAFVLLVMLVTTRVASQIAEQAADVVNVEGSFADMAFFSSDKVTLKAKSTDDVFAAGSNVTVSETTADHLILAGGEISLTEVEARDLIAAGGEVSMVDGIVTDDVVVAGGEIRTQPKMQIGGSAVFTGGNIVMNAPVANDLRIAAGTIKMNATVGGNAKLIGEKVEIGPNSRINGNLLYRTDNLTISEGAVITGQQIQLPEDDHYQLERWSRGGAALFAVFTMAIILGIAVLVIIITVAVPGLMNASMTMIRARPWRTLGIGVLITLAIPFAIFLLFTTVIGVPLALLIGATFLAVVPIALAATSYLIGMRGRELMARETDQLPSVGERLLWPALGALLIVALGFIPYVGGLVWLFALILGIGAVVARGGAALARPA